VEHSRKLDRPVVTVKQITILSLVLIALNLVMLSSSHAGNTSIKCWKNKQKIRECGQVVPPEYAQQRIEILNDRGIVIKVIQPARTKKQLVEDQRKAKLQAIKDKRKQDDIILLKSFTTERDLLLSRDANLSSIKGIIDISIGNTKSLKTNLGDLQKKAGDYERSGQTVPPSLIKDIDKLQRQIKDMQSFTEKKEQERTAMIKRYDEDLKRYRMLKKVKPR